MERDFEQQLSNSVNDIEIPKSVFAKAEVAFNEIRSFKTQRATRKFLLSKKHGLQQP